MFNFIKRVFQLIIISVILIICIGVVIFTVQTLLSDSNKRITAEELTIVASTFGQSVVETVTETTQSMIEETKPSAIYTEKKDYAFRVPDKDLPDFDGIEKDVYGNYIITQEMFDNVRDLPTNIDGYIEYIYYYDEEGNILNPMPEIYSKHLDYFEQSGG